MATAERLPKVHLVVTQLKSEAAQEPCGANNDERRSPLPAQGTHCGQGRGWKLGRNHLTTAEMVSKFSLSSLIYCVGNIIRRRNKLRCVQG